MRCERCLGNGRANRVMHHDGRTFVVLDQCPDCAGSGIAHCCEGLCAQPEESGKDVPDRP